MRIHRWRSRSLWGRETQFLRPQPGVVVDRRRRQDHSRPPSRLVRQALDGGREPAVVLHDHGAVGSLGRLPLATGLHDIKDVIPDEREEAPDVLPELRLVGEAELPLAQP